MSTQLPLPEHFASLSHEQQIAYYRTQAERAYAVAERQKATIDRMKKRREPAPPRPPIYLRVARPDDQVRPDVLAHVLPPVLERLAVIAASVSTQLNESA